MIFHSLTCARSRTEGDGHCEVKKDKIIFHKSKGNFGALYFITFKGHQIFVRVHVFNV